jgi:hypothetical protein
MEERKIIGLIEEVEIKGKKLKAKIDTGADRSSIDISLALELGLVHFEGARKYRNALGSKVRRPLVKTTVKIFDKEFETRFSIANRLGLSYKVLIGKDILQQGKFMVDPLR